MSGAEGGGGGMQSSLHLFLVDRLHALAQLQPEGPERDRARDPAPVALNKALEVALACVVRL